MEKANNQETEFKLKGQKATMQRAAQKQKKMRRKQIKTVGKISLAAIAATAGIVAWGNRTTKQMDIAGERIIKESEAYKNEYCREQKTAKEKFFEDIKVVGQQNANKNTEDNEKQEVIEKILQRYNEKLPEGMEEISKEDIGIVKENLGDGNIYRETDEEGQTKYIQNHTGSAEQDNSKLDWVEAKDIKEVIAILDKENHTTIAGMGIIDGDYVPVEIQQMILQSEYENPYTESDYYVKLKGSPENYQALEKAYEKRVQELSAKTEQDTEMELS